MKIRAAIAAAGGAALLGAGSFALPASAASPAAATHKLSFISVTKKSVMFTKTSGGSQDTDVSKAGKTVGFDLLYFAATSASGGTLHVTIDTRGGFLYGTAAFSFKTGAITHGKVTGGAGAFKGATGTLKARNLNRAGTRTAVTITYRT
jgi:hypothetical protein